MGRNKLKISGQDQFGYYSEDLKKKKLTGPRIFLTFLFIIIMLLLIGYPFRDKISITGNLINFGRPIGGLVVSMELDIPQIDAKGDYEQISILALKGGKLIVDGEEFVLDKEINEIYLEDFSGKISLDKDFIYTFDGKTHLIKLNDLKINNKVKNTKISVSSRIPYSSVSIDSDVYLKSLEYNSTGNINLDGDTITLKNNGLAMESILAKLRIKDKRLFILGDIQSLSVDKGEKKIKMEYKSL